ncbi:HNH endonuclease [Dyadobacter sp.]|uniref:HNH endonuclease n=1 Tax=Dyadobacter sp. TaxID=1914288 RepID=UPI003F720076
MQGIRDGLIQGNKIYITLDLVSLFNANWNALVTSLNHHCRFFLPFYHLSSEPFWKLIPKQGYENLILQKSSIKSFSGLNASIDYAEIDEDLFYLMQNSLDNKILYNFLLNEYFPETKSNISQTYKHLESSYSKIEGKILNEPSVEYKKEIQQLMLRQEDEEIFIRSGVFKREIPKIYNNTCCISNMRIDANLPISLIDACHIVPFSKSYNDTISNGIALCPNLHRAFDRGLISIDENYNVRVSDIFKEGHSDYSIRKFDRKRINLPRNADFWPDRENLIWHGRHVFQTPK